MKKNILLVLMSLLATSVFAQFTQTTIKQIQQVSLDSLKYVDSIGYVTSAAWTKQVSPIMGQKVEITALVNVPPYEITFNSGGRTLIVSDTGAAASQVWTSILVLYGADNTATFAGGKWTGGTFDQNGYNSIQRGDIVTLRGTVTEFPTGATNSLTQFAPDTNESVIILSSGNKVPPPAVIKMTDLNVGTNPGGHINFINGEPLESKEVMLTNLTITAIVNAARGTWAITDTAGNTLSMYDYSTHFTIATRTPPRDSNYIVPVVGTKIDTIRGYVGTVSGGEANRGYRLAPIFPSDVKYGAVLPGLTTHRRNPVIVTKDSVAVISAKAFKQIPTAPVLANVKLVYRVNNGAWVESTMVATQPAVDSTYTAKIPKQNAGDYVYYFIKATDANNQTQRLANTSNLSSSDTSKGVFFFKSLDRSTQKVLTIRDAQYTPFINGRSPYIGAVDSIGGIVTADTASLLKAPLSVFGTNVYYMQSTNQPFSGIWVVGPDSIMQKVQNGDSIIVKGTVNEFNDVTEIFPVTAVRVVSKSNPLPTPLKFKTDQFGPSIANGNLNAEPYEGMLVRFDTLTITAIDPVFQDPYQYEASNSTQPILVARDGRNTYSNNPVDSLIPGIKRLKVGTKINSLTGILFFNNSRYKVVPRTNADYDVPTGVNVLRTDLIPGQYVLGQNYPNPFNPTTKIEYGLPLSGHVTLRVYNIIGQEVMTLVDREQTPGLYTVSFDASKLASGMYLYRIQSGTFSQVKKMMLIK